MKRTITTAAFLFAAAGAFAQVRVVSEIPVPASPAASAAGAGSAFSAPVLSPAAAALTPSLGAPSLTPSAPAPAPAAAAPAALQARAALIQTGAALAAASKGDGDPAAISRETFDAAAAKAPSASPVAGAEVPRTAALEGADYARRFRVEKPLPPLKKAAWETVEVGAMSVPFMLAAAILRANAADPAVLIPLMIALWGAAFWAMRSHLAGVRSTVVGGWQASHDQKYRVDPATGRLKDIRGHKYGEDRYEEYAPGPVGRAATVAIGAAAALGAAAFLLL